MKRKKASQTNLSAAGKHLKGLLTLSLCGALLLGQQATVFATGEWTENAEVLNKDTATQGAYIKQDVPPVPEDYNHAADPARITFLVQKLDYVENGVRNGFNGEKGTDYYLSYSIDKTGVDNTVFVSLVDRADGTILETKQITPGQTIQFAQIVTEKYIYTIEYQTDNQLHITNGQGGGSTDTVIYNLVTSGNGGGFNEMGIDIPTMKAQHITRYITVDETPEELAKYTQTGDVAMNKFIAPKEANIKGYEYVAEAAPDVETTRGFIAAEYDAGGAQLQYYKNYKQAVARYITRDDGTARVMTFIINPDYPNFKEYYLKESITTEDLRLNEIMAVVNNPNRTPEDVARLNSAEFPFLVMFISEELAPGQYNEGGDALGRPDPWVYQTTRKWRLPALDDVPGHDTDSITNHLGPYNGHDKGDWKTEAQHYLINDDGKYIDLDGQEVPKQTVIIGGMQLALLNRVQKADMETVYKYRALNGSVVVDYIETSGTSIAPRATDTVSARHNTAYDTEVDLKPLTIVAPDGRTYRYTYVKPDSAPTIGKVVGGEELVVTYVYDLIPNDRGAVVVHYVDTQGNVIKAPVYDEEDADAGTPYDTSDKKEKEITFNGKTYRYKEIQNGSEPEKGDVEGGKSKNITYVYELAPEKGSVKVHYVDEQGVVIKDSVFDEENADAGKNYDTAADNKPQVIKTADGKEYELVKVQEGSAGEQGQVVGGQTLEVTYVYKLKSGGENPDNPPVIAPKGSVLVHYVDESGNVIKAPVYDEENADAGKDYDTASDNKPKTIKTPDGKEYELVRIKEGSSAEQGKVVGGGTLEVTYVYKLKSNGENPPSPPAEQPKGKVIVRYVDEKGNVIKDPVYDEENAEDGKDYDTSSDNKPKTIKSKDGKEYELVKVKEGSAAERGKVIGGKDLEVTYIYKLKTTKSRTGAVANARRGKSPKTQEPDQMMYLGLTLLASTCGALAYRRKKNR